LEQYLADLNRPVGDEVSSREEPMVEIRVAVSDATRVHGLTRRLAGVFDRSSISFDRSRKEVRVKSEWESRGVVQVVDAVEEWLGVVHVVDAVEEWLAEDGVDSATLSIGNRSYTLAAPAPIGVGL
jgi:hypothetical protein